MKMKIRAPFLLVLATQVVACGSSDGKGASNGTLENPCGIESGYDGDQYCILPPAPGEGVQLHAGPTDYDDPVEVESFLLNPGEENVEDFAAPISESGFYYLRQQNRMRPSSHHMVVFTVNDPSIQPGLVPGGCSITSASGFIQGSQTPSRDFPSADLAPEDEGMATRLNESTVACFQLHYINTNGDGPVLREGWINLYKEPEASVTQIVHPIFMVADVLKQNPIGVSYTDLTFAPAFTTDTRIYGVSAHMHAHATQFKAWRQRPGQAAPGELIYESFDWHDPLQAGFNSKITNPTIDEVNKKDGAISGLLYGQPGDTFRWQCEVTNTTNHTLTFGNKAEEAEMCMFVGSYIAPMPGQPGLMSGMCAGGSCGITFPL